ncbi:MAG: aminotransferase class I/II-fold pyridoxal phosphate-dependent enzyme [Gemmatimonadaceae bacterium]
MTAIDTRAATSRVSAMAGQLAGSGVLKIAGEVRALRESGREVCDLTVGDFASKEFPIPSMLLNGIETALRAGETNYPPSAGMPALRQAIRAFYLEWLGLDYPLESILVASGARPAIYATYRAVVDPGDVVVYTVPSWNNDAYCAMVGAESRPVPCEPGDGFLPTCEALGPALPGARLLVLNSPANPTGTAFTAGTLAAISDLVLEENARRGDDERPLFLLYDQVYWMLTFGDTVHVNPVSLRPEMAPYTILVDGISKAFASTGLRVGWLAGPADVVAKMSNILGHVGAWAPRAEQVATAKLLGATAEVKAFHARMVEGVRSRLDGLYDAICDLARDGYPVEAIAPEGAIYLSARFALNGARLADGTTLRSNEEIRRFLLDSAQLAVVPFQAFGSGDETGWFRLSVGAVSMAEIAAVIPRLRTALAAVIR